jgi:hypothetical protein
MVAFAAIVTVITTVMARIGGGRQGGYQRGAGGDTADQAVQVFHDRLLL